MNESKKEEQGREPLSVPDRMPKAAPGLRLKSTDDPKYDPRFLYRGKVRHEPMAPIAPPPPGKDGIIRFTIEPEPTEDENDKATPRGK